jgi:hypothetical protein
MEEIEDKIPLGEKLIINYHIAHQLYDDLIDISHDIKKPDLSYMLNAFRKYLKKDKITKTDIKFVFEKTHIRSKLCNVIKHYLSISEMYTKQLKFDLFLLKIKDLEHKIAKFS